MGSFDTRVKSFLDDPHSGSGIRSRHILPAHQWSSTFLVMYSLGNILSIKYPFTRIMSTAIRNIPIIFIVLLRRFF